MFKKKSLLYFAVPMIAGLILTSGLALSHKSNEVPLATVATEIEQKATPLDLLPADFPMYYGLSIPENSWSNENNVKLMNFSDLFFNISDGVDSYMYTTQLNTTLTKAGNNYFFTCADGTKTTFVMESNTLTKIKVSNHTSHPTFNGEYIAPRTIGDILPDDFPTSYLDGWLNENGKDTHLEGIYFFVCKKPYDVTKILQRQGNNFYFTDGDRTVTFIMNKNKLVKINVSGDTFAAYNGDYVGPYVPSEKGSLSGGAIAGIAGGSFVGVCLLTYVVMFFVWKKNEKALKFLKPSFNWLNGVLFKKK